MKYLDNAKGNIKNLEISLGTENYIVFGEGREISIDPNMLSPVSFLIADVTIDNMRGRCVRGAARNSVYSNVVRKIYKIFRNLAQINRCTIFLTWNTLELKK